MITNPAVNWLYSSEPEPSTNGRRIPVPRGKLLGGSSAINGLAFVRGQAQDFDTWAQMGNQGWSFDDCMPYFKRLESYPGGAIVRATGLPPSQGWWEAELVPQPVDENGTLVLEFHVFPPITATGVVNQQSREITVAYNLSNIKLDGISNIVVQGANNARSSRR